MSLDSSLVSLILVLIASGLLILTYLSAYIDHFQRRWGESKGRGGVSSIERLAELAINLNANAIETYQLIDQITNELRAKQEALAILHDKTSEMAAEEERIRKRIDALNATKSEVFRHFEEWMQSNERKGVRRDLVLFVAGAIVTTVLAVILKRLGLS